MIFFEVSSDPAATFIGGQRRPDRRLSVELGSKKSPEVLAFYKSHKQAASAGLDSVAYRSFTQFELHGVQAWYFR
jgi:hypothetical protein